MTSHLTYDKYDTGEWKTGGFSVNSARLVEYSYKK